MNMILPIDDQGYITGKTIREAVEQKLTDSGWVRIDELFSEVVLFKKDGIHLDFKYDRPIGYHSYFDKTPQELRKRQPTQVRMFFNNYEYHQVFKTVSYKKFSFEWVERTFEILKEKKAESDQIRSDKDAHYDHMNQLNKKAKALNDNLDLSIDTVEADRKSEVGQDLYRISLSGLTVDQIDALHTFLTDRGISREIHKVVDKPDVEE